MKLKASFDNGEYINIDELINILQNMKSDDVDSILFDVDDSGTEIILHGVNYDD